MTVLLSQEQFSILEITNTLLQNLCSKLTKSLSLDHLAFPENGEDEFDKGKLVLEYQTLLLSCIGKYTEKMPNFQKEIRNGPKLLY